MLPFVFIALCFFLSLPGKAGTPAPIPPGKQKGTIAFSSEYGSDKASFETWIQFCENLGKQLSLPKRGFLSSFVCQSAGTSPSVGRWHIKITERKASFDVELNLVRKNVFQIIRTLSFPTQGSVLKNLDEEALPIAIARMLVEDIPTGWAYKHTQDKLVFDTQDEILPFPTELFIYELFYDKKEELWIPRMHARVSQSKDRDGKEDSEKALYAIDTSYLPLQIGKRYWVRSAQDSKERQIKYKKMITDALQGTKALPFPKISKAVENESQGEEDKSSEAKDSEGGEENESDLVNDLLLGSFRSSYAGLRYGMSLLDSDSIITDVSMLSILAEIGSGPLSGLRWYYDIFPEVKRGSGVQEEHFSLKRASLGWAFSFDMPAFMHPLLPKIDVQPKIGLLDLKSHFFAPSKNGKVGLDFNVKNVYDLALEIGAEKTSPWFRTRLWGAISTANFGLSNKDSVSVKSTRGGIDAYFDLFESGNWDVNLLTFASAEHLEISKDPNSLDRSVPGLYAISSNILFAGLGFTISW